MSTIELAGQTTHFTSLALVATSKLVMNSISELITTVLEVQPHRGQKMAERLCLKNSETTTISNPAIALRIK